MDDATIAKLQAKLVTSIIDGTRLPGLDRDLSFPDLQSVRDYDAKIVSSLHLATPAVMGDSIEILDDDAVGSKAESLGPFPYLRFQAPSVQGEKLTLSVQLMTGFDTLEPLPLGAVVASFEKSGDDWMTVEPSHVLAY